MAKGKPDFMLRFIWISVAILVADQVSKWVANSSLVLHTPVPVLPGYFDFMLAYNTGAAFSFLSQAGGWQRWFFSLLALGVSIAIVIWIKRLPTSEKLTAVSLSLILGGAVGNLIDRLLFGHVIDFIQVYFGSYAYPAFNIADSAISVGAVLLIVQALFAKPEEASHGSGK
ncbi:unnamed protein product [Cyprideis torosa]|uniref:Uncharacterized protein n=1 Tax=Cyprideis torosa TaxID=163714 RepID=A0A7R8WTS6_9CRUS|nr:unnamed protein product [Cyprideis torosa]CAG0910220.1 unnamed protein product [Cyprideis torosa]